MLDLNYVLVWCDIDRYITVTNFCHVCSANTSRSLLTVGSLFVVLIPGDEAGPCSGNNRPRHHPLLHIPTQYESEKVYTLIEEHLLDI